MKALLLIPLLICGCAQFRTIQHDQSSLNEYGQETRTITTRVSACTLFSASSELTKFAATQTDKTQSAKVGGLNQSATDTNFFNALSTGIGAALKVYSGGSP